MANLQNMARARRRRSLWQRWNSVAPSTQATATMLTLLAAMIPLMGGVSAVSFNGWRSPGDASSTDNENDQEGSRRDSVPPDMQWRRPGGSGGIFDLSLTDGNVLDPDRPPPFIDRCPTSCRCYYQEYRGAGTSEKLLTVNCTGLGLFEFPESLPANTQVLDMSGNSVMNLTTLPRLPQLLVLDVSNNWMRGVDNRWLFEHVAQLAVLNLAHNSLRQLQDGTFMGLSHLLHLDVSGNRLQRTELHAFADLKRLTVFRMDDNSLYDIRREWFLPMQSLIELRLSRNGLSSLGAGSLPLARLQHLDLSQNRLRQLEPGCFNGLENLRLVNLSNNQQLLEVPNAALKAVPGLDILLMDGLGVTTLGRHAVSGLSAVEMSLSYMPELRAVGREAFHNLSRLQTLQLHDCPRLAFMHPGAFSGLPELRRLLIHNNALVAVSQRIVTSLPSLADLHLYHNPLRCDCNVYWLRKELSEYSRRFYSHVNILANASSPSSPSVPSPTSFGGQPEPGQGFTLPPSSTSPAAAHTDGKPNNPALGSDIDPQGSTTNVNRYNHFYSTIVSDPGRVSCFFPDGASSLPLVQQPLQYFPRTCPPIALAFFQPRLNVSLGEPMDLQCAGLGVPQPAVAWVLPSGEEISAAHAVRTRDAGGEIEAKGGSSAYLHQPTGDSSSSPFITEGNQFGGSKIKTRAEIRDDSTLHIPVAKLADSGTYRCHVSSTMGEDWSTVVVHVQAKPLTFEAVTVSNEYMVVAWQGSIPRAQMGEFQLFYRKMASNVNLNDVRLEDTSSHTETSYSSSLGAHVTSETAMLDLKNYGEEFRVVNLHGSTHTSTISGLEPKTRYEVCLVYRGEHPIQCQLLTTTAQDVARLVRTGAGIAVRITKAQIGAGIGLVLGALIVIWAGLVLRRSRRRNRKNYQDYAEDKANIPLEGIPLSATPCGTSAAPSTPLASSRTALLPHAQI